VISGAVHRLLRNALPGIRTRVPASRGPDDWPDYTSRADFLINAQKSAGFLAPCKAESGKKQEEHKVPRREIPANLMFTTATFAKYNMKLIGLHALSQCQRMKPLP